MDMTLEAIKELKKIAVDASRMQAIHPPQEPQDIYYLQHAWDEKPVRMVAEAAPRNYGAESPEDFANLVKRLDPELKDSLVFVGSFGVVGLMEEKTKRRERIRLKLTAAPVFADLMVLETARAPLAQAAFVRMLRVSLNGAVPDSFIATCRSLKFSKSDSGNAKVQHANESMGREVNRVVMTGDGKEFPEDVMLTLPVYEECPDKEWNMPVRCAVDIDVENCRFTLIPMAGELAAARRWTHQKLAEVLRKELGENVPVVCGTP